MEAKTKNLLAGLACMTAGLVLIKRADKLTIVKDGVELPNEGGYIRSQIAGRLLASAGIVFLGFAIFKK